jgi:hypothetical protein
MAILEGCMRALNRFAGVLISDMGLIIFTIYSKY